MTGTGDGVIIHVAPWGADHQPGSEARPLATLAAARDLLRINRASRSSETRVIVHGGVYYLNEPLLFTAADSGASGAPVVYQAAPGETVTISGGQRLACRWEPYRDGIMMCRLPAAPLGAAGFDQLFVNGKRQVRARFPNRDDSDRAAYSGYLPATGGIPEHAVDPAPDPNEDMTYSGQASRGIAADPSVLRSHRWQKPDEAVIHCYQSHYWGNLQWRVKAVEPETGRLWFGEGGYQIGAKWSRNPAEVNERSRFFVENVFEELDAPGEWYFDRAAATLYFLPPADLDLTAALIEAPVLPQLIRFVGEQNAPVAHITLEGFRFAHTAATFLEPYTIPSLSDWAIHRGGALFLQGSRDCTIRDCWFDAVGGNAVFLNNYNRGHRITGNTFTGAGESAVCLVGSLETTNGSRRDFAYECTVDNNLIHDCGEFGKQTAGVYISRAKRITVSHNEMHSLPRAGICIGDGTWGGHLIEYNFIHDTCRETGDHGSFNAWGRDRYWCLLQSHAPHPHPQTPGWSHAAGDTGFDAMEPVILRYNHFAEDAGWGLDLDDGASHYEIHHNFCIGASMKLREGAHRTVFNNIWLNGANSPCFHVGNDQNHDRYVRNITVMDAAAGDPADALDFEMGHAYGEIYTLINPPATEPWLEEIDHNCFFSTLGSFVARVKTRAEQSGRLYSLAEWQALGFDRHSVFADPGFVDPARGDFRLRPDSPALALGFESFDPREAGLLPGGSERWRR